MFFSPVNTTLLPIKLHYFFYYAAVAPLYGFLPVIARQQLGFSNSAIGVVFAIVPLITVLAKPAAGAIADVLNAHKAVFLVALVLDAVFYFSFQFIPPLPREHVVEFFAGPDNRAQFRLCAANSSDLVEFLGGKDEVTCWTACSNGSTDITFIPSENVLFSDSCYDFNLLNYSQLFEKCSLLSCTSNLVMDLTEFPVASTINEMFQHVSFWCLLLIVALNRFSSGVVGIADAICFKLLKNNPFGYGCQRMWGAVAYGVTGPLSSYLVDIFTGDAPKRNYKPAFYTSLLMFVCCFANASQMKFDTEEKSSGIKNQLLSLISNIETLIFLLTTFIFGVYSGLAWVYLFIYIEAIAHEASYYNWIASLEGLIIAVQCASEIPALFISPWVLKKIGHKYSYSLVMAAWAVRFSSLYFIVNPWHVLLVEPINALTFGVFYAAMTTYAHLVAPRGAEATVQGVTSAVFEGAGVAAGGLLGGVLIDLFGVRIAFLSFGLSALGFCLFHLAFNGIRGIVSQKEPPKDLP